MLIGQALDLVSRYDSLRNPLTSLGDYLDPELILWNLFCLPLAVLPPQSPSPRVFMLPLPRAGRGLSFPIPIGSAF